MEIKVYLHQLGEIFSLKVESKFTLSFVKMVVQIRYYIHKSNQSFTKNGRILRDGFTLSDYDIKDGDQITLTIAGPSPFKPYTIYYRVGDKERESIEVMNSNNIDYVKNEIRRKTSIPIKCMKLRFNEHYLESGSFIVDYNIIPGSTLSLEVINC